MTNNNNVSSNMSHNKTSIFLKDINLFVRFKGENGQKTLKLLTAHFVEGGNTAFQFQSFLTKFLNVGDPEISETF